MTIRTKRRGRTLAAILAAMLMASVLSVVAGAPAQAANTSGEHLIDTNGDGKPDSRQFDGAHRYVTAQLLADAYATQASSPATVIIASGESEVDAVTAAGLAGNLDAPVLLTRGARLPHNVARYIDSHNVTRVIVVGGPMAVSEDVVTAIKALGSGPKVDRFAGDDRYATAAAIGGELGGPNPTWCGSTQSAAILVNGGSAGRADAIAIGPIAFRLGLPVLLTMADELPQSTEDFLSDNKVEHVVIVGGTGAVSDAVKESLVEDVGVVTTRRIAGGDAADTSVEIAKEMLGRCAAVMGTDTGRVALVNRDATADGVAAAPAMGEGLGNGPIPILLVGDELPAAVSDYLASTAEETATGAKTDLSIVAVGGTAVVSTAVMDAAVAAAKTSPPLTATIVFKEDTVAPIDNSTFTVTFSDDVTRSMVEEPNLYRINGRRLEADASTATNEGTNLLNQIHVERRTVTVDLVHDLKSGDVITVVGGGKVGASGDMRTLETASLTVALAAATPDTTAPAVEIVAVSGRSAATIFVTEPNPLKDSDGSVYMAAGGITIAKGSSKTAAPTITSLVLEANTGRPGGASRYTANLSGSLSKGNVIQVARNTFQDTGNRGNRLTRATVADARADFAISSVSIGNVQHVDRASAEIPTAANGIVVTAKAGGIADGSAGNGWRIFGYDLPTRDPDKPIDIDVEVDTTHKVISYTVNNGEPTLLHLAKALSGNDDFAANFGLSYVNPPTRDNEHLDLAGDTNPAAIVLSGGTSRVAVRVSFNDVVRSADLTGADNRLAASLVGRPSLDTTTDRGGHVDLTVATLFRAPDRHVWFTYTSDQMSRANALPTRGGTRVVPSAAAMNYHATSSGSSSEIVRSLRSDAGLKPFDPTAPAPEPEPENNAPTIVSVTDGDGTAVTIEAADPSATLVTRATLTIPETTSDQVPGVQETLRPARLVATVTAADQDAGDTFTLWAWDSNLDHEAFDRRWDGGDSIEVWTKAGQEYDFETKNSYTFLIVVEDDAGERAFLSLRIDLSDVAEPGTGNVRPVFPLPSYSFMLPENANGDTTAEPPGSLVNVGTPVVATDDTTPADAVTYTLGGADMDSFAIDSTTGQITFVGADSGDYEASPRPSYSLTVTATGGTGARELTATVPVSVTLTNVDEAPVFGQAEYAFTIPENTDGTVDADADNNADGVLVGSVSATDPEGTGTVTYTLGGDDVSSFAIDAETGAISIVIGSGDYEADPRPSYALTVTASDGTNTSGEVAVAVTLTDVGGQLPGDVEITTATPGAGTLLVAWTRLAENPDIATVTHYLVQHSRCMVGTCADGLNSGWGGWSSGARVNQSAPIDTDPISYTISGLAAGNYRVRVLAVNSAGTSPDPTLSDTGNNGPHAVTE